jgi:small-conductance mechanosensitive channel
MLENFGKKLGDLAQTAAKKSGEIAQTAAKKSGEVVETTKLNMSINGEEESIRKLYAEIGKLYFESVNNNTPIDSVAEELCDKIKEHQENIDEYKEKIKLIKEN